RGRVLIGANEAAVHTLLPLVAMFRARYEDVAIVVLRVHPRRLRVEVGEGRRGVCALAFPPTETGFLEVPIGTDELGLLVPPTHALAGRRQVTMEERAADPAIAPNL